MDPDSTLKITRIRPNEKIILIQIQLYREKKKKPDSDSTIKKKLDFDPTLKNNRLANHIEKNPN